MNLSHRLLVLVALLALLLPQWLAAPIVAEAAAIGNVYATETTDQTETSTSYVDHLTVASTSLAANATYLLFVNAQLGGDSGALVFGAQMADGGGTLLGSEKLYEPSSSDATLRHPYAFATKYQPGASPDDLDFQMKVNASGTARADSIVITLIRVDADLTEDEDWFFDEQDDSAAPVDHTNSMVARASKTFTPGNNNDDWMIVSVAQILINDIANNYEMHQDLDSGASTQPFVSQEGEDADGIDIIRSMRVRTLTNAEHTLAVHTRDDVVGTANQHNWSAIIGLRLDAFEDHGSVWTEAPFTFINNNQYFSIASTTVDFTTTGDIFVFGHAAADVDGSGRAGGVRIQVDSTTHPTGHDANDDNRSFDASDELALGTLARVAVSSGNRVVDLSGSVANTDTVIEDSSLAVFSAELAAAPPAPAPAERRRPTLITEGRFRPWQMAA